MDSLTFCHNQRELVGEHHLRRSLHDSLDGTVITDHRPILLRKLLQRCDSSYQRNALKYSLRESWRYSETRCVSLPLLLSALDIYKYAHTQTHVHAGTHKQSLLLTLAGRYMSDQCFSCQKTPLHTSITLSKLLSYCVFL